MNFTKLIRDGVYKEEDLTKEEQCYVNGMRNVERCIDACLADFEFEEDGTIIGKLRNEIATEFANSLKEDIKSEIAEFIVCIQDERAE
jgi:hypothetical protein